VCGQRGFLVGPYTRNNGQNARWAHSQDGYVPGHELDQLAVVGVRRHRRADHSVGKQSRHGHDPDERALPAGHHGYAK
jgi:hypothetical protein